MLQPAGTGRLPEWFKIRISASDGYKNLKSLVKQENLHTVCQEAGCPNIHECWGTHRTAAFMILGDTCTRRCRFCDVKTGKPQEVDALEPYRIAKSVQKMRLDHAFVTMVNRDDLSDGGAGILADTVLAIRRLVPDCAVEVLSSDLMGNEESIRVLVASRPDIVGHNIETVRRLTPSVRSRSEYDRSLLFLRLAKQIDSSTATKSSLMLGLGETEDEVLACLDDLRRQDVDMINIGQYLQPSRTNIPVKRYWNPEEFEALKQQALARGFTHCESGPLVRSSYHAGEQFNSYRSKGEANAD